MQFSFILWECESPKPAVKRRVALKKKGKMRTIKKLRFHIFEPVRPNAGQLWSQTQAQKWADQVKNGPGFGFTDAVKLSKKAFKFVAIGLGYALAVIGVLAMLYVLAIAVMV